MVRTKSALTVVMVLTLVVGLSELAQAQQRGRGMMSRSSMIGLLSREQVQTEMNLTDAQKTEVAAMIEKLMEEAREQFASVREIQDRQEMMAKMTELSDQLDEKLREQLRGMGLEREQMMRLYQIRLQVNPVVDSLASERLAGRLNLTDEQKQKLAEVNKDMQAKQAELYAAMANASQEDRGSTMEKLRELRTEADQKALDVLTAEQKASFEEMKGKIVELESRRGRRGTE